MKRTLIFVGLAFLILAPPAQAQQNGKWHIEHGKVHASGTAKDGNCAPEYFDLLIDIFFGPGNKVETVQGDQRTVGAFDPETGKIKTSSGPESYTLEPDGKKRLTGFNTYNDCRWTIDFKLDKPGLVFVEAQAPEPAATPTAAQVEEEPVGAVGAAQQEEGGGMPLWIPFTVVVIGGAVIVLNRRRASATAGGAAIVEEKSIPPLTFKNALVRCKSCGRTFEPIGNPYGGECPACGATWGNARPLNESDIPTTDEAREQMRRNAEEEWIRDREATKEKWLEDHPDGAPPGTPEPEVPGPADWGGRGDSLPRAPQG